MYKIYLNIGSPLFLCMQKKGERKCRLNPALTAYWHILVPVYWLHVRGDWPFKKHWPNINRCDGKIQKTTCVLDMVRLGYRSSFYI